MSRFEFTFAGNPIPKGRPEVFGGRGVTPARTRKAERELREYVQARMAAEKRLPFTGPIRVELHFFRNSAHRCDLDNLVKLALDGANKALFCDDSQVVEIVARKSLDRTHPRTVIAVEEVTE